MTQVVDDSFKVMANTSAVLAVTFFLNQMRIEHSMLPKALLWSEQDGRDRLLEAMQSKEGLLTTRLAILLGGC